VGRCDRNNLIFLVKSAVSAVLSGDLLLAGILFISSGKSIFCVAATRFKRYRKGRSRLELAEIRVPYKSQLYEYYNVHSLGPSRLHPKDR